MKSRMIKGWRTELQEKAAELRMSIFRAYSITVYTDLTIHYGVPWYERPRWFRRVFFQERAEAMAEMHALQLLRRRTITAERTEEQKERDREDRRRWRASKPPGWLAAEGAKRRIRVEAKPEVYRAIDRRTKAKHRDATNARRRVQYAQMVAAKRAGSAMPPGAAT